MCTDSYVSIPRSHNNVNAGDAITHYLGISSFEKYISKGNLYHRAKVVHFYFLDSHGHACTKGLVFKAQAVPRYVLHFLTSIQPNTSGRYEYQHLGKLRQTQRICNSVIGATRWRDDNVHGGEAKEYTSSAQRERLKESGVSRPHLMLLVPSDLLKS